MSDQVNTLEELSAVAGVEAVAEAIARQGFYLQLPPAKEDYLLDTPPPFYTK